ncbi:helix-turn-helix domain-containing protein [Nocardia sp. NPDC059229]|uniref:helix-turn-helix domain-containing protein n=1 Tax=Nocardia sp. NPDC059229 TaxID=3346778 RepID=UPI0036A0D5CF
MQIAAPSLPRPGQSAFPPIPPTQVRRGAGRLSWVCERPEIGGYLRRQREALGLTQEEVALAASTTLSSLRKWEAGLRKPSTEGLAAWCRALNPPDWMLRKIMSLALGDLDTLRTEPWPRTIGREDLAHLESFSGPAFFIRFPDLDVVAANGPARQLIPSLTPADLGPARPVNLAEWIMTDAARELLVDWRDVAVRVIHSLRVMGPGIVPQQRLDEIFNACYSRSPKDFKRFFATDPVGDEQDGDALLVRNLEQGTVDRYTYRSLRPTQPMCPYDVVHLIRSTAPRDPDS